MKGYLKLLIRHRCIAFFVPIIAGFLLLIFLGYYYRNLYVNDIETIKRYVIPDFHLIISLMSGWWPILLFSEFVSEQGNEVFYLYFPMGSIVKCQLFLEMIYNFLVIGYFIMIRTDFSFSPIFLLFLIGENFFVSGMVFFLVQLTKNTSIVLGVISVYCVYLLKFDQINVMGAISIFPENDMFTQSSLRQLLVAFGFALVFYIVGGICYKKRKVYY